MKTSYTRGIRFYPLSELDQEADARLSTPSKPIYSSTNPRVASTSASGMPAYVTQSDEIQIIACRNIRTNLRLSLMMAMRIAYQSPVEASGYAGGGWIWDKDPRMRPATDEERDKTGKDRFPIYDYKKAPGEEGAWENSEEPRVLYVNTYASDPTIRQEINWLLDRNYVALRATMPLGFVHCPIGTWPEQLEKIRQLIMYNSFSVLVLNSFEFTTLTQRQKQALTLELIKLKEEFGVTVIVFTQDVRKNMEAGMYGRGPIGMLQTLAQSVVKIEDDSNIWEDRMQDLSWKDWLSDLFTVGQVPVVTIEYPSFFENYEKSLNARGAGEVVGGQWSVVSEGNGDAESFNTIQNPTLLLPSPH